MLQKNWDRPPSWHSNKVAMEGGILSACLKNCNEENPKGHGFQVKINRRYFGKGMKRTSNYTYKARSQSYSLATLRVHADTACFKGADGPKGSPLGLYLKMYTMSFPPHLIQRAFKIQNITNGQAAKQSKA